MEYGTCEIIGSALSAGLKSTFFFFGGFAVLTLPALVITHFLLKRNASNIANGQQLVLAGLKYFILWVVITLGGISVFLFPIMGPLFLAYSLPALFIGLFIFSFYIWKVYARGLKQIETSTQQKRVVAIITAIFIFSIAGFVLDPLTKGLLKQHIVNSYEPSIRLWPGALTQERCFDEKGGSSYLIQENGEWVQYFPDGTSKDYPIE